MAQENTQLEPSYVQNIHSTIFIVDNPADDRELIERLYRCTRELIDKSGF